VGGGQTKPNLKQFEDRGGFEGLMGGAAARKGQKLHSCLALSVNRKTIEKTEETGPNVKKPQTSNSLERERQAWQVLVGSRDQLCGTPGGTPQLGDP